jgi:hypothetical protein
MHHCTKCVLASRRQRVRRAARARFTLHHHPHTDHRRVSRTPRGRAVSASSNVVDHQQEFAK